MYRFSLCCSSKFSIALIFFKIKKRKFDNEKWCIINKENKKTLILTSQHKQWKSEDNGSIFGKHWGKKSCQFTIQCLTKNSLKMKEK